MPEQLTGPDGKVWTRSEDLTRLTCEDGRTMFCNPEMTSEYVLSCAYLTESN